VRFTVRVADVDELEEGAPERVAVENARRKAEAVASEISNAAVLGADTIVCLDGQIYAKPADPEAARATLGALSGRQHDVIGGICLVEGHAISTRVAVTEVEFRELSEGLIEWYLSAGEWRERAGAYAIQGRGAALVRRIEGDYLNVVGLPVAALLELAPWLLPR
jgi:septum formation protein